MTKHSYQQNETIYDSLWRNQIDENAIVIQKTQRGIVRQRSQARRCNPKYQNKF